MSLLMRRGFLNIAKQSVTSCTFKQNYSSWCPPVAEEFRELRLKPVQYKHVKTTPRKHKFIPSREENMKEDQDWVNAWPTQRSFHPASVPLPVRQGIVRRGPPPAKEGNLELMKIPNFLHLTPPAIERHCAALRKFCTKWPEGLETNDDIEKHFPVEIKTSDYLHSSPTIRDPLARVVTLQIKLSVLPLDEHARDKFRRLVGDRYDEATDTLTIVTDRCPMRQQNTDYAQYLLTALFFESWKKEEWESEKSEADMEKFVWDGSKAQKAIAAIAEWCKENPVNVNDVSPIPDENLKPAQADYKKSVEDFWTVGESEESLRKYKKAAEKLLYQNSDAPDVPANAEQRAN